MDSGAGWQAISEAFAEEESGDFFFGIGTLEDGEDGEDGEDDAE